MLMKKAQRMENWAILRPVADRIGMVARQAPEAFSRFSKHIRNQSLLYAYAYYVGLVAKWQKHGDTIVDWGGQFGHVTLLLQERFGANAVCYLVDCGETEKYWHNALGISNVRIPRPNAPVGRIDYDDESVDAVVSSGVLEHTFEYGIQDLEALREIYRILRPGGRLFVWHLPARNGFPELSNKATGRYYHNKRYDYDELICLLSLSGFRVLMLDKHEILHPAVRGMLMKLLGYDRGFAIEYAVSKIPLINYFAQHFTIVAEKVPGFSFPQSYQGAVSDTAGFGLSTVRD